MSTPTKLSSDAIQAHLSSEFAAWQLIDNKLFRSFELQDFYQAFAFMTEVAIHAQVQDHHPEWFNVYNRVDISLTTHDCSGVSEKDFALAGRIEATYKRFR